MAQNIAKLLICNGYTGCWICLNKPEYALIIPQYVWIYLNNAEHEYDYIYLNKQSAEFARILNMSDAVHNIRSLNKLGHFNNQGNILEFFLLDTLKTTFWMEIITQKWIQPGFFFSQNQDASFKFQKVQGGLPSLSWLRACKSGSICIKIPEYV